MGKESFYFAVSDLDGSTGFSISVDNNFTGEAGLCIRVFCSFTVPQNLSEPLKGMWFKGDPQNPTIEFPCFNFGSYSDEEDCSFLLGDLIPGKSDGEYRFKVEYGQGKIYIFPQTVTVTVKELTQKPAINVPVLTAGEMAEISCQISGNCPLTKTEIVWKGIDDEFEVKLYSYGVPGKENKFSVITFNTKQEHHNTNLTCTVIFEGNIQAERSVTLELSYAPIILNSSCCTLWGDELTCVCVSDGVPLPQIHWPLLSIAPKYYSIVTSEENYSVSTISISGFRPTNTSTIGCVSSNAIGETQMEIQVQSQAVKVSGSLSTLWMFFTLSIVLHVIIAVCMTFVIDRRREKCKKPKDDNHIYMTTLKTEESLYESINLSAERS
ncbi:sialic acid-binding Ig-like lectin 7 [Xyrauchen texanus]|uniref:sialic acid-binding Ig-like lectin 7 n=1 Tax=Xyrauchen texanus TaxID=154827 RepID=UPI002241B7CA|nr:sialic acid-binding Ig-like lectin 7 [Xyrauchen texanus]